MKMRVLGVRGGEDSPMFATIYSSLHNKVFLHCYHICRIDTNTLNFRLASNNTGEIDLKIKIIR